MQEDGGGGLVGSAHVPAPGSGGRRRTLNACARCRQHKIKCSGSQPCERCARRRIPCVFGERQNYSPKYVRELQRRVAAAEQGTTTRTVSPPLSVATNTLLSPVSRSNETGSSIENPSQANVTPLSFPDGPSAEQQQQAHDEGRGHVNVLALGQSIFVPDSEGRAFYLGTSSTWSFSRRVLLAAYDRILHMPLPPEDILFPGKTYKLGWNGHRTSLPDIDTTVLPDIDFAAYLINAVKFYAGQLFHLFDETIFMESFRQFHEAGTDTPGTDSLWYIHYLLILAFGKAFVARANRSERPVGCEFFVQAMALLPDLSFSNYDAFEAIEVFCCAALYLHSLDFRSEAYRLIGDALRLSLDHGLHTDMHNRYISSERLERARKIWWTVHLLDRQITSLQGLPVAVRDEDISAGMPSFSGSAQKLEVLEVHIQLSKVMATIAQDIYGKDGRLDTKFLIHTKQALKSIAAITAHLDGSNLKLQMDGPDASVSRMSAHVHLLQHEVSTELPCLDTNHCVNIDVPKCIVLATRPILFNFFEARLAHDTTPPRDLQPPAAIWALLVMCRDSAFQMLKILRALKRQDLLESFLPFDLNATYTSAIVLLMASHIDAPLLDNHTPWIQVACEFVSEMKARGNKIAGVLQKELDRLGGILGNLPRKCPAHAQLTSSGGHPGFVSGNHDDAEPPGNSGGSINWLDDANLWNESFNAEQMAVVAESIDLDGIDWWFDASMGI